MVGRARAVCPGPGHVPQQDTPATSSRGPGGTLLAHLTWRVFPAA